MIWIIGLAFLAISISVIIKWPLLLWALATISGVIGAATKQVGLLALAVFFVMLAVIGGIVYGFKI